mgnify:CR=1 FL=1
MKSLLSLLIFALAVVMMGCSENAPTESVDIESVSSQDNRVESSASLSKKPLRTTNYALFNPGFFADPVNNPTWYGTFTSDGTVYGQVFYSLGSGKPFDDPVRGRAFFAEETWSVYTWIDFDPATQTLATGDLLMRGYNRGVQDQKSVFHAHGRVLEAYGEFSMFAGRPTSGSATVEWAPSGLPYSASGETTFR